MYKMKNLSNQPIRKFTNFAEVETPRGASLLCDAVDDGHDVGLYCCG